MNKSVKYQDLGQVDYLEMWNYQESLLQQIVAIKIRNRRQTSSPEPTPNHLLFVSHPPVYTLGKSGDMSHLLLSSNQLEAREISFYQTNRGGDITYHGPGQVVGYPIFDLGNFFEDIHRYLRDLEEVIIRTLSEYGLSGSRSKGETGVWLDVGTPFARKICAMGIRASRWVTMHGFALNVNTDMNYFDYIVPCGIRGKSVTSLAKELKYEVSESEVKAYLLRYFSEVFKVTFTEQA